MQRIAVLSTDSNPGYHFYLPIVTHYWRHFGWEVAVFTTRNFDHSDYLQVPAKFYPIPDIENVRPNTLAQTVRHFVSDVLPKDAYIMVQDIDLIPLRPYEPDMTKKNIWGWELTGKSFIPVHYTGMLGSDWYDLMDCTGDLKADMERELKRNGRAYKEKWEDYWDTDWDILTQKVLPKRNQFNFVERGLVTIGRHTIPRGRVDRSSIVVDPVTHAYSWGETLNQPELIDAHCENHNSSSPEKWKNIKALLMRVFGEVPAWMDIHAAQHFEKYGIH